ncbi:MAG: hypothetical protein JSW66_20520 [Phycisphaerales bacterium]|nr:MAG: hypothetical protein JSW66_20520 [Phycisphaerales bacterium]
MRFDKIDIDPQKNPAVLDTATWEAASAWSSISALDESYFEPVAKAIRQGRSLPEDERCLAYSGSAAESRGRVFLLARLADGQHVFVEFGPGRAEAVLGEPIGTRPFGNGMSMAVYGTDMATVERYVSQIRPDKGPKALGATARLGVGSRMSVAAWPGVWRAMDRCNSRANPIQNSVREVNLLDDILAGRPPRHNYMANFGRVEEGHTGSTFEGLWVAGILEGLKTRSCPPFGADADHITVRRGDDDIARAGKVVDAARLYTFFTLDVSDILDYGAMNASSDSAEQYLEKNVRHSGQRRDILLYHGRKGRSAAGTYELDEATIGRLVGKYWSALDAVEQLSSHIHAARSGMPFDLELSIDETPTDVDTFACLTTQIELMFLTSEFRRRQIPATHIAPNFGVEKGFNYRGPDGLPGLEERIRGLCRIAGENGILLDCHSGDDLSEQTRKAIGRAADGQLHFKVSPALQVIFAETLNDFDPKLFSFWWDDTLDYARREAGAGSDFAADCLRQHQACDDREPSPGHAVFHYYSFATVGRRDENGQFMHRQKFYDLPAEFYRQYQDSIADYLCKVASDVFGGTS